MSNSYKKFEAYAIEHGIHNGPATLAALESLYNEHKGSHYNTIVELFKVKGLLKMHEEMNEGY